MHVAKGFAVDLVRRFLRLSWRKACAGCVVFILAVLANCQSKHGKQGIERLPPVVARMLTTGWYHCQTASRSAVASANGFASANGSLPRALQSAALPARRQSEPCDPAAAAAALPPLRHPQQNDVTIRPDRHLFGHPEQNDVAVGFPIARRHTEQIDVVVGCAVAGSE